VTSSVREYRVSFDMDDVETVRDLALYFPHVDSRFHVHPDPVIDGFRAGKKIYKGEALILTVRFPRQRRNCTNFFANGFQSFFTFFREPTTANIVSWLPL